MYHLSVDEAMVMLGSNRELGLSDADARRRLDSFGPNVLPRFERRGPLLRLLAQFNHPLIFILLAAAAITFLVGAPVDASVILGVVLVNAAIGFAQESRAERSLVGLASMITAEVTVVRDGRKRKLLSDQLVPGDIVVLAVGDKIAADLRLLDVEDLRVDESALTGESVPVAKLQEVLPPETVVADRANMAFSGTLVARGSGVGIVVATGSDTEIGHIHRLIGAAEQLETPLMRKITHFSKVLTVVIVGLAAGTFAIGLARGDSAADMLVAAAALAVGAIPEGLPAAMTITLAIGVNRMAARHAIVRRLPAVETLGSTTVICTDKTGTLTKNQMTVQTIFAGGEHFEVTGIGYGPAGELCRRDGAVSAAEKPALRECLMAGTLCNDTRIEPENGNWRVVGDPTEAALLVAAWKGGLEPEALRNRQPRVDSIPFESEKQFMATLHKAASGTGSVTYVKGSAERVLAMCNSALDQSGAEAKLDRVRVLAEAEQLGRRGFRVLAMAEGPVLADHLDTPKPPIDLCFLGLQAMTDPPRPEAITAVQACQRAGIQVKMVTGDHTATAQSVAHQMGLKMPGGEKHTVAITGAEMDVISDEQLGETAARTSVFGRVSPQEKLRLVEALQQHGEIAAMTGDGVNDAPALKRADVGVAMGQSGTDAARDAADIVITDDNFASIEAAVEEGRHILDNLTKFIVWTLPTNMGEGFLILVAIAAGVTLPILPVQILWINMVTAVALGLMLAFEQKEPGLMDRPPRDPKRPLLTGALIARILLVSFLLLAASFLLFEWEQARGASIAEARTVAINVFVFVEIFYLFNCRSLKGSMLRLGLFSNRWLVVGVATTIVLQILLTYAPPMNDLFHTAPIEANAWALIFAVGTITWGVVGTEKWLRKR